MIEYYKVVYIPALIPETNDDAIVIAMTYIGNLIQNAKGDFFTNKLELVVSIIAENYKEHKLSVSPYANDMPEFKLHRENRYEQSIQVYLSMEEAAMNHL